MVRTEDVSIEGRLPAFLALPDNVSGPTPGVIVIHEVFGLNTDIRRIASRFASEGYTALAPDLYHARPKLLCIARTMRQLSQRDGPAFDDLEAARAWLAERPEVAGSRLGVAGFCMGGGFALLFAARAPLGAAAPFYGAVPREASDLEGICPVIAGYGERDRRFAGHGRRLESHLSELGVPHDVKLYPQAGHSFMNHQSGLFAKAGAVGPMKVGYHHDSAEDAWARMLRFFAEHLV